MIVPAAIFGLFLATAPSPSPSPSSLHLSMERVIDRLSKEREDPCRLALAEGRPCFPVETVLRGREISVRESLGVLPPATAESPSRPPTRSELAPYLSGAMAPSATLASFDPGCVAKSILKSIRGKNDVYHLYRLRDVRGVRLEMYDHRLDATFFQGEVEYLGEFRGECEAVRAWNSEIRKE